MGATNFGCEAKGINAKDAFMRAVDQARYEEGHCGYTGTVAEKPGFKMVTLKGRGPYTKSGALRKNGPSKEWNKDLERREDANDKWDDALCVELCKGLYYFFGVASC